MKQYRHPCHVSKHYGCYRNWLQLASPLSYAMPAKASQQ